jgi:hypothetical protein
VQGWRSGGQVGSCLDGLGSICFFESNWIGLGWVELDRVNSYIKFFSDFRLILIEL